MNEQTVSKFSISKDSQGYAAVTNNPKISVAFNRKGLLRAHPTFPVWVDKGFYSRLPLVSILVREEQKNRTNRIYT